MSPEQASGDRRKLTVRSDVYSLGAILYELLTGQLPIENAEPLKMLQQIQTDEPPSPRQVDPSVSSDLSTICMKCLEKDPTKRYENAGGFADDLDRWLSGEPIAARPTSRTERAWRWCRRNPLQLSVGSLGAVLILVVLGIFINWEIEVRAKRREEATRKREQEAREAAIQEERLDGLSRLAIQVAARISDKMMDEGKLVESAAQDSELLMALQSWAELLPDKVGATGRVELLKRPEAGRIRVILERLMKESSPDRTVVNWKLLDADGIMVARAPMKDVIGWDFGFREYFQGTKKHHVVGSASRIHVSKVFQSVADGLYKYSICAPVLDGSTFLGVLALSGTTDPDMGLSGIHDERLKAVLVAPGDPTPVPKTSGIVPPGSHSIPLKTNPVPRYVVLVHPALNPGAKAPEFDASRLPAIDSKRCGNELGPQANVAGPVRLVDYVDPFRANPDYGGTWLAVIVPVGRTGFYVIAQRRNE